MIKYISGGIALFALPTTYYGYQRR